MSKPIKLTLDQNFTLFQNIQGKKPKCKVTSLLHPQELFIGISTWLTRQSEVVQKSLQFLGVFSLQKDDIIELESSLLKNWNTSFFQSLSKWNEKNKKLATKQTKDQWECENCEMENASLSSSCLICEKPKTSSTKSQKQSFHFDLFQSQTSSSTPTKKQQSSTPTRQEMDAVLEWKAKQLPTSQPESIATTKTQETPSFQPQSKEFNFIYKILSELNQEQVKHITFSEDRKQEQPRYLFAIFKNQQQQSAQTLVIDKIHRMVEWFDPFVSPPTPSLNFTPDPQTLQLQKVIQNQRKQNVTRNLPEELKETVGKILQLNSQPNTKWSIRVNKQENSEPPSDFYSLWYLTMRFSSEKGGPYSAEKVDSLKMSFKDIKNFYSEFFQKLN